MGLPGVSPPNQAMSWRCQQHQLLHKFEDWTHNWSYCEVQSCGHVPAMHVKEKLTEEWQDSCHTQVQTNDAVPHPLYDKDKADPRLVPYRNTSNV